MTFLERGRWERMTPSQRDSWLALLALHSGRLSRPIRSILRRIARELASVGDDVVNGILIVLNPHQWATRLRLAIGPVVRQSVLESAVGELRAWVSPAIFALLAAAVRRRAQAFIDRALAFAGIVFETLRRDALRAMRGFSGPDALEAVKPLFTPQAIKARADKIADTETTGIIGGGKEVSRLVLFQNGYLNAKRWETMQDERVRHTHEDAEGQIVGINQLFRLRGGYAMYPGDQGLPPNERIGCRCASVALNLSPAELVKRGIQGPRLEVLV